VAQSVWELVPYRIQVFVSFSPAPELTSRLQAELLSDLVARTDMLVGAPWDVTAAPATTAAQRELAVEMETMAEEPPPKEWLDFDKVMLLAVTADAGAYRVTARELDIRTRTRGAPVSRQVWQLAKLRDAAVGVMFEAFAPLARIDTVKGKQVVLRLKAAALPVRDRELALVKPGDVFRPIIRFNDSHGNPRRITPVPWTFCTVEKVTPEQLDCRLHSGLRSPLSDRRRGRVQQLALAMVPAHRSSNLTLVSQSNTQQVLAGYDVYARGADSKASVLLGRTDRRGCITVPPVENPLRVLLIRNGTELLARLPMVPGLEPQLIAEIVDDEDRLEAEGFITGLQEELVDMVTRREVLLTRTKARIEAKQFDQAVELVSQLRRLPSKAEFARMLTEQRKRIRSTNSAVQAKINLLFADTQTLLEKHLDPQVIEELWQQLRKARGDAGS
jgi:hypothetical protein